MGNINDANVIIYIERGQLDVLNVENPILRPKELLAVYDQGKLIGHKLGDGESKWSELDYIDLDMVDEFNVYDKKQGYICKIIINPIDKVK